MACWVSIGWSGSKLAFCCEKLACWWGATDAAMILNRTRWLGMVALAVMMTGCQRRVEVSLKRDGSPAEMTRQFTNLLATGDAPGRLGAVRALGTLATESWDPDSTQIAITALLR